MVYDATLGKVSGVAPLGYRQPADDGCDARTDFKIVKNTVSAADRDASLKIGETIDSEVVSDRKTRPTSNIDGSVVQALVELHRVTGTGIAHGFAQRDIPQEVAVILVCQRGDENDRRRQPVFQRLQRRPHGGAPPVRGARLAVLGALQPGEK